MTIGASTTGTGLGTDTNHDGEIAHPGSVHRVARRVFNRPGAIESAVPGIPATIDHPAMQGLQAVFKTEAVPGGPSMTGPSEGIGLLVAIVSRAARGARLTTEGQEPTPLEPAIDPRAAKHVLAVVVRQPDLGLGNLASLGAPANIVGSCTHCEAIIRGAMPRSACGVIEPWSA